MMPRNETADRKDSSRPTSGRGMRLSLLLCFTLIFALAEVGFSQHRTAQPRGGGSSSAGARSSGGGSGGSARTAVPRGDGGGSYRGPHRGTGVSHRPPPGGGGRPPYYPGYPGYPGWGGGWGYWGPGWDFRIGFGWGWPGPYYSYWGYPVGGVVPYGGVPYGGVVTEGSTTGSYEVRPQGSIELKVKPKKAGVYVDGNYVGIAGQFDGFPRYLWLPAGRHTITLSLPGYENFDTEVEVQPARITTLKIGMTKGTAVPPYARSSATETASPAVGSSTPKTSAPPASGSRDLRAEPSSLLLTVHPADASVYVDGRFVGTGREVSSSEGLWVDAGEHRVQVLHPDHRTFERVVSVDGGQAMEVEIDLRLADPV